MEYQLSSSDLPYDVFKEDGNKIKSQYADALQWLKGLGLPAIESRLGKYKKVIDNFGENLELSKDDVSAEKTFHEFLNAHMEAVEVIRIYNTLSHHDFLEFSEQLKKVTAGQAFRNVSKNDPSRDFMFELTTASRFINGGFEVKLNHLADIVAVKKGFPKIFVECKRIRSPKRIQDNVKKANEQLKKRIASDKSKLCKGIIALNVNELINPENDMSVVNNVGDLQRMSSKLLESFVQSNERNLESKKFNKCLGVLIEATMEGYTIDSDAHRTINCRGAKLYQYENSNSDEKLVKEIGMLISNQNIVQ
jgi:hypothetical protein